MCKIYFWFVHGSSLHNVLLLTIHLVVHPTTIEIIDKEGGCLKEKCENMCMCEYYDVLNVFKYN